MKFKVWNCSQEALQPLTLCSLVKKKYGLSFFFFPRVQQLGDKTSPSQVENSKEFTIGNCL